MNRLSRLGFSFVQKQTVLPQTSFAAVRSYTKKEDVTPRTDYENQTEREWAQKRDLELIRKMAEKLEKTFSENMDHHTKTVKGVETKHEEVKKIVKEHKEETSDKISTLEKQVKELQETLEKLKGKK